MSLHSDMMNRIAEADIHNWNDISAFVDNIAAQSPGLIHYSKNDFYEQCGKGIGFITYDFGIDGVSIEIFKYAEALENIFKEKSISLPLHFIAGDFHEKADVVLKPQWRRFQIDNMNGWNKWGNGSSFSKLFYEDMPEGSAVSDTVAKDMWHQACEFAEKLGKYLEDNNIGLLIPVNIPTNPGNFAIMLAITIVSEAFGTYVLSSNHDFYWEGGKPASERAPDESPGVRDHFFRNCDNRPFWNLFTRLYPWDGKRWIQVNINRPQVEALIQKFDFNPQKVSELGTSISETFFRRASRLFIKSVRTRMNMILSGGKERITTVSAQNHLKELDTWMNNQKPLMLSYKDREQVDLNQDRTLYCLQPTRVVGRKRIEMDLQMLKALFHYPKFAEEFKQNSHYQLVLHITGPTPVEHRGDLETVIQAYIELCKSVDEDVARRIYLAFSVGNDYHPIFEEYGYKALSIEDIYHLATVILFPSETEGRGLPIIESSAGGIPIICSQYYPEAVFEEVVGSDLPDEEQIKYILFPEDGFSESFLKTVRQLLLERDKFQSLIEHNRKAVHLRYSTEMIRRKFKALLEVLRNIDGLYDN
ncbi:MAG: glycosyltransferase [Victivallales bacterium]|nr:glycosyltransferase [Victivallales bacterium]